MRILLPTLHVRRSAQAVPLAAANLKAALPVDFQHQTRLLDLFPEQTDEDIIKHLLAEAPELIAFPLYLWNRQQVLRICRHIRQQNPSISLIAGGPEASADAAAVITEGHLDGIICGEGELVFAQLLRRLAAKETVSALAGFVSADCPFPEAALPPDLAELPSPWLTGILPLQQGAGVLWEVARGCCFNCAFCFDAKGQQGVRTVPLKRLQQELQLFTESGVSQVWVLDSTFNAPPERGKQFLQLLIEQAPQLHFHLEAKADFLDQETAEMLSYLSCSVQIGLQSANVDILKPLHRSLNRKKMSPALQQLSQQGVTYGLDLIYGLPDDCHQGFSDSLNFALQQQPNQVDIFPLAVLPGTELHQRQSDYGLTADPHPPYLIREHRSYPAKDLLQSQILAAATDIFYNRGRAVGFFLQLCEAMQLKPAGFLSRFATWLEETRSFDLSNSSKIESCQPSEILPLQQDFAAEILQQHGSEQLCPLVEDLINYHFCCAELLLAAETVAAKKIPGPKGILSGRLRLNPNVKIQSFNHDLEKLEQMGGEKLGWAAKHLKQEQSYGIFLQQQGELIVESLQNDFAQLLLKADGQTKTANLLTGLTQAEALELLEFAISQGILHPVT